MSMRRWIFPVLTLSSLAACGVALAVAATAPAAPAAKPAAKADAKPAAAAKAATPPGAIKAETIPPGYHFPTPRKEIDAWVAVNATGKFRNHAWDVWAGMTAPSHSTFHGARLPIWETWYSENEVFVKSSGNKAEAVRTEVKRPFAKPRQFAHVAKAGNAAAAASTANEQVVAFNKFDPESAKFLMASHPTPKGSSNSYLYTQAADLEKLNLSWPSGTAVDQRAIVDFPDRAVDTKPVMWLIKATGLTPFPLWQGTGSDATTNAKNPTPETWLNCVLIDPKGKGGLRPATPAEVKNAVANSTLACKKYLYAPLSMMYSFKLTAQEATDFNSAQGPSGPQAAAGDYAVLAAMHVTTKEIVNWTWQTFWWSGGKPVPKDFPGSTAGMTANIKGPWRNYAMCTAYSMVVPYNDPNGKPVVCFNPFLETSPGIPDGIDSNCMSCHGTARWPGNNNGGYPATYLPNGYINFNDPTWFGNQTRTDFAWAIPGNAVK